MAATILCILYTIVIAPPAAVASLFRNGHPATFFCRLWSWLILRTCGIRAEVEGLENLRGLGPCVLISNHQSLFDIMAVFVHIPGEVRFVAKKEIRELPLLGFILWKSENIVIDRERGGQAIRRSLEVVRHGYSICVFAEGHRFSDNSVHDFSDGAAWLAIATRLPCVPMAISGTAALMPAGAKFVVPGGRIRITLGKPIETKGLKSKDRAALTTRLESEVRATFSKTV